MFKSKLQELCQQHSWELPVYATVKEGPDHCPRFTATVTIGGIPFQTPKNLCKSSKEAQNLAAKIAFEYFTVFLKKAPAITPPSPSTLPSPGFVTSTSSLDARPAKNDKLQQKPGEISRTSMAQEPSFSSRDENRPKVMLHLYKNRLQHYAQKKNLTLPEYSYEFDGPPHARRFRASVTIDKRTYRSPEYFFTLKDAEHAAAKVAFESLSLNEIQEDEGLYKTLLQELAQKEGFCIPSYSTMKTGPCHAPTFVSTVEGGGEIFQGRECKTKKQSEMNAAKVAYDCLMERRRVHTFCPVDDMKESREVKPVTLEPVIIGGLHPSIEAYNLTETHVNLTADKIGGEMNKNSSVLSPGSRRNEAMKIFNSSLGSVVTYDLQPDVQPKPLLTYIEKDGEAKEHSACCLVESDAETPAESCTTPATPGSKILDYPRESTMPLSEGASILPCTGNQWMAVKVTAKQDH